MLTKKYSDLDPVEKDYISHVNEDMMNIIGDMGHEEDNSHSHTVYSEWYDHIYQYYEDDYNDLINDELSPIVFVSRYIVDDYEDDFGDLARDYRDLSAEDFIEAYGKSDTDYKYTDEEAKQVYQEKQDKIYDLVTKDFIKKVEEFSKRE